MTQQEADKIAAILATADHGCSVCVEDICEKASAAGLGFIWAVEDGSDYTYVVARPVSLVMDGG